MAATHAFASNVASEPLRRTAHANVVIAAYGMATIQAADIRHCAINVVSLPYRIVHASAVIVV